MTYSPRSNKSLAQCFAAEGKLITRFQFFYLHLSSKSHFYVHINAPYSTLYGPCSSAIKYAGYMTENPNSISHIKQSGFHIKLPLFLNCYFLVAHASCLPYCNNQITAGELIACIPIHPHLCCPVGLGVSGMSCHSDKNNKFCRVYVKVQYQFHHANTQFDEIQNNLMDQQCIYLSNIIFVYIFLQP